MALPIYTYPKLLAINGIVNIGDITGYYIPGASASNPTITHYEYYSDTPDSYYTYLKNIVGIDIHLSILEARADRGNYKMITTLKNGAKIEIMAASTGNGCTFRISLGLTAVTFYASSVLDPSNVYWRGSYLAIIHRSVTPANIYFGNEQIGLIFCGFEFFDNVNAVSTYVWSLDSQQQDLYNIFNGQPFNLDDPYITNDNHTPGGGYGDFDYSGDDDLPPSLPTLSAAQVGFVSLWNPSQQEMKDLADYLWTGTFDLTNFKKLFTDPMECILSVGIVPVTPTTGTATEIVFGGSSHSGVNAKPITSQFVTVDLGKVHINGQSASALDYSPYVKVSIFLPYCGTYALDADDVMDADIELEYHIDIYTGACVAYLTITKTNSDGSTLHSTLYQFTGNCLASIPITGDDHSQFIQSMLFMGAAVAATVATSGAGAPAIEGAAATGDVAGASAVNAVTASSAVNSVMSMKPNVLRSGNLSSTAGLLGKQRPCITVTWPNLCRPDTEYKLLGMPVHKSGALSDFEGFTIVSAVHVENILCTEIEKQMIEQMLYKGVMV